MLMPILLITILFYALLGLLIGSFLNVCVYRIPRHQSVAAGRSHCPQCGHVLGPLDLVPVASYLLLHKKCRYCKQPISPRYAQIEAFTGLVFALSGFAVTALGLWRGATMSQLIIFPLLDVTVWSFLLTAWLIRRDLKAGDMVWQLSHTRALQVFLAAVLAHIWVIWLLLG